MELIEFYFILTLNNYFLKLQFIFPTQYFEDLNFYFSNKINSFCSNFTYNNTFCYFSQVFYTSC